MWAAIRRAGPRSLKEGTVSAIASPNLTFRTRGFATLAQAHSEEQDSRSWEEVGPSFLAHETVRPQEPHTHASCLH